MLTWPGLLELQVTAGVGLQLEEVTVAVRVVLAPRVRVAAFGCTSTAVTSQLLSSVPFPPQTVIRSEAPSRARARKPARI
jgi:hypothetical protein